MRYIDIERLEELEDWPPGRLPHQKRSSEKWRERLRKAEEELRNLPDGKTRSDIFVKYSHLWSDVKEHYRALSYDKCWYCETSTHRIPGDIDHYRPKAGVTDTDHPGYWWLGFDWRNWRFACRYCNSQFTDPETGIPGGKGNYFPLLDGEKHRILDENECEDYEDLLKEGPVLLDPTEHNDPVLLTFTRDGLPGSTEEEPVEKEQKSGDYRRAKESIRLYHLDHSRLVRVRRRIYNHVYRLVHDYQRFQKKWEKEHDRSAQAVARRAAKELGRMIAPDAEYSMTARAYLKEYRNDDPIWSWVDRLLTAS
ncbi:MAG TPA: hypothetical protein VEL49_00560 [Ktedonobacteraceae bacterium]|nr:hypothetical protein [Ktedonobacteraceae bacterium]